tara:strand:- start:487 stop:660 length:174 start_codon:yes stop_codon:yes gene_type:complete
LELQVQQDKVVMVVKATTAEVALVVVVVVAEQAQQVQAELQVVLVAQELQTQFREVQ